MEMAILKSVDVFRFICFYLSKSIFDFSILKEFPLLNSNARSGPTKIKASIAQTLTYLIYYYLGYFSTEIIQKIGQPFELRRVKYTRWHFLDDGMNCRQERWDGFENADTLNIVVIPVRNFLIYCEASFL